MVTSEALIGMPVGSFVSLVPGFHMVCFKVSPTTGPRSPKIMIAGMGKKARAPYMLLRISFLLEKPDSPSASFTISSA